MDQHRTRPLGRTATRPSDPYDLLPSQTSKSSPTEGTISPWSAPSQEDADRTIAQTASIIEAVEKAFAQD